MNGECATTLKTEHDDLKLISTTPGDARRLWSWNDTWRVLSTATVPPITFACSSSGILRTYVPTSGDLRNINCTFATPIQPAKCQQPDVEAKILQAMSGASELRGRSCPADHAPSCSFLSFRTSSLFAGDGGVDRRDVPRSVMRGGRATQRIWVVRGELRFMDDSWMVQSAG